MGAALQTAPGRPACGPAGPRNGAAVAWRNAAFTAMVGALLAGIMPPARAQCAPAAPVTGLGTCIDSMAGNSARVTRQINGLGYRLHYGPASYTDYELKRIYIQAYDCRQVDTTGLYARAAIVAHELGHAEYGMRQDTRSRAAFIESACDSEGHAVINNILARAETLQCSAQSMDIGLAASNAGQLLDIHRARSADRRRIGEAFCQSNFTSTTRQNYRDYYGAYYDAHY
ncbi:MAG: hypothetical protein ABWY08_05565 [Comamonas sp.]